jgi:hypothetical protein
MLQGALQITGAVVISWWGPDYHTKVVRRKEVMKIKIQIKEMENRRKKGQKLVL